MLKPRVYQKIGGKQEEVESSFAINEDKVRFRVSDYDKDSTLIIDPGLLYSSYLGGSSYDAGNGVAVDDNQNAYIIGSTASANFPTLPNAYQGSFKGNQDVFLTKIDTTQSGSSSLIYSTYLGGISEDGGNGIAVDNNQNAYIVGSTRSSDFPTKNAYQSSFKGNQDVFLTKIDTTQNGINSLIYSTYLGGISYDEGKGVAVDNNQNAYITGYTNSDNFPTIDAYQDTRSGDYDAFLAKLSIPLSSNKFADKNFVNLGDTITYTVSITNTLATTVFNVLFIDTIPTGTTFTQDSLYINGVNTPGANPNPPGITIPDISAGGVATVTYQMNITCQ